MLIAPFPQQFQKWRGGWNEAPFSSHRLNDDCGHIGLTDLGTSHFGKRGKCLLAQAA